MPNQSMNPDNSGGHPPDPALAEAAIAQASIAETTQGTAMPTEDDLELFRAEYYDRHRRAIRTDRRLGFLFALLVIAFVILAYRTEHTDTALRDGLYTACNARVEAADSLNQVRQVFIDRIAAGPSGQTTDGKLAIQQLQSFLQPVEDCGPDPR